MWSEAFTTASAVTSIGELTSRLFKQGVQRSRRWVRQSSSADCRAGAFGLCPTYVKFEVQASCLQPVLRNLLLQQLLPQSLAAVFDLKLKSAVLQDGLFQHPGHRFQAQ